MADTESSSTENDSTSENDTGSAYTDCTYSLSESPSVDFSIMDNSIRNDIVFGFIRLHIEKSLQLIIPDEIKSVCALYYRYYHYINSSILNESEKIELIKILLEQKVYKSTKKMTFNLIFNTENDGFSAKEFHSKCDDKNGTLTIIENDYGNVFGAYSWIPFTKIHKKCYDYYSTEDRPFFLFRIRCLKTEFEHNWWTPNRDGILTGLDKPKVFRSTYGGHPEFGDKYGPSFSSPLLMNFRILDNCNVEDENMCYHAYERGSLGFQLCGVDELGGGVNCWHQWYFKVRNYEIFQMENERWKRKADLDEEEYESDDDDGNSEYSD
eukprot:246599_1